MTGKETAKSIIIKNNTSRSQALELFTTCLRNQKHTGRGSRGGAELGSVCVIALPWPLRCHPLPLLQWLLLPPAGPGRIGLFLGVGWLVGVVRASQAAVQF